MPDPISVSGIFAQIMANTMKYVEEKHGEESAHRLFFELYSHTFDYLDREHGFDAVEKFWEFIADTQLGPLEELMRTKGFAGMEEYWTAVAAQEGGRFDMKRTESSFDVVISRCPPCEWFHEKGLPHYPRYSEHCRVLYSRVANRCGFQMNYTPRDEKTGVCCGLHFTKRAEKS